MNDRKQILRATGVMGAATLGSRLTGLVRDVVVARLFGAGLMTDAFFLAFTLPNLLRRFFAEGSLTAAFVPVFTSVYQKKGDAQARLLAERCASLLLLVMAAVTILGILFSPWIVQAIGYGFGAVEGKLALTNRLNQVMFSYLLLVSLLALFTGVLNVLGHFFMPAISPVFLNVAMVGCAILLHPLFDVPIMALAIGVLVGGFLQLLLQLPVLYRYGYVPRLRLDCWDQNVARIARLMLPGIAGVAIYQINVVVTRLLASFLQQGSVTWLYYGQRLFEFPQGLFVVSLAQAFLPAISRQASAGEIDQLQDTLRYALGLIIAFTIPATTGLILCAEPVYDLFFRGGAFGATDVKMAAVALSAYAPGLIFVGLSQILVRTFYALEDTRTPVFISVGTLLVSALCGLMLMGPLGHVGLALALTISSMFNAVVLALCLYRKIGPFKLGSLGIVLLKTLLCAAVMAPVVFYLLVGWNVDASSGLRAAHLFGTIACGGLLYLLLAVLIGLEDVKILVLKVCRRIVPPAA